MRRPPSWTGTPGPPSSLAPSGAREPPGCGRRVPAAVGESLRRIARQPSRADIEDLIAPRGLRLDVEDGAYDLFLRRARQDVFGAREIKRVVDADLRQPLAEHLLSGPLPGDPARGRGRDGIKILRA